MLSLQKSAGIGIFNIGWLVSTTAEGYDIIMFDIIM